MTDEFEDYGIETHATIEDASGRTITISRADGGAIVTQKKLDGDDAFAAEDEVDIVLADDAILRRFVAALTQLIPPSRPTDMDWKAQAHIDVDMAPGGFILLRQQGGETLGEAPDHVVVVAPDKAPEVVTAILAALPPDIARSIAATAMALLG